MAYSELEIPDRANHLWRYTPWHRIHPSGKVSEVPDPYYGGSQGFENVLDILEDACLGLLEFITTKKQ